MATSRDDITVEVAASQYRQAADAAYRAAVGGAAPGHLPGESLAAYRVRLADGLKGIAAKLTLEEFFGTGNQVV